MDERIPLLAASSAPGGFLNELRKQYSSMFWRRSSRRHAQHWECLDGVRAMAFLWVVAYHSAYCQNDWRIRFPLKRIAALGWCGVSMFLALSGFLMSYGLDRASNVLSWFGLRFFRIWPSLVACALVSQVLVAWITEKSWRRGCGTHHVVYYWLSILDLTQNWGDPNDGCGTGNLWSVALECQFYLLLPAIAFFRRFSKRLTTAFVAGCAISLVWFRIVAAFDAVDEEFRRKYGSAISATHVFIRPGYVSTSLYYHTPFRAAEFLSGVLAYYAYDEADVLISKLARATCLAGAGAFVLIECALHEALASAAWIENHRVRAAVFVAIPGPCVAITTGALMVCMCSDLDDCPPIRGLRWILSRPFLYPIASLSYTSYLMGSVMLSVACNRHFAFLNNPIFGFSAFALVSLALGLVISVAVERPCIAISRTLLYSTPRRSSMVSPPQNVDLTTRKKGVGTTTTTTTWEWALVVTACVAIVLVMAPRKHAPRRRHRYPHKNYTCTREGAIALYPEPRVPSTVLWVDRPPDDNRAIFVDLCPNRASVAVEAMNNVVLEFEASPSWFGMLQAAQPSTYLADAVSLFPADAMRLGGEWARLFAPDECVRVNCSDILRAGECRTKGGVCAETCRNTDPKVEQVAILEPPQPSRIVVFLHGYGQDGWLQATSFFDGGPQGARLHALVDDMGFVLAAISATTDNLHAPNWMSWDGDDYVVSSAAREYVTRVIDTLLQRYPSVDPKTGVYLVGWAQGADMAISYACHSADKVAGFWAVVPTDVVACDRPAASKLRAFFEIPSGDPIAEEFATTSLTAADAWKAAQNCSEFLLPPTLLDDTTVVSAEGCVPDGWVRYADCGEAGSLAVVSTDSSYHWPVRSETWPARAMNALFDGHF
ncbi:hypothetical protein CTAYLR_001162 [Chrysophaeum taylorii]|uniref:Acyltransferase 3 domain-containing protein n=1 Tax=Chrysophaeum taylorii TaxID=2483200 RepID=A0AAD7XNL6_9STRA|nr:hypothetical protein CTAYLR_001162 [Chrysophaeum taylorii]